MKRLMIMAAISSLLYACGEKQTTQQQDKSSYATVTVTEKNCELTNTYSATIQGRQDIAIMPQIAGTLTQLCITEGEVVKKGQTLFIIDQVPYQAALQTANANVEAAEAAVATAQLTYDSKSKLFEQKVISTFDKQTSYNALLNAKAGLAQAHAQQVISANNLSYTVVKSPSDGVVGTLPFRVGALVSPSMPTPLTNISDNSEMYVYFSLTENELLDYTLRYGSMEKAIAAFPPVKLQLSNGTEYSETGKIESISGVISQQTGTVTARAVFSNPGRLLHSGASGNVQIPYTYENAMLIPQTATVQLQNKMLVYKIVDGKAVSTVIEVASINNGREFIVTDGLQTGDEIISEGAGLVREGTQIK